MAYAPPRPRVTRKQRAEIFQFTNGCCNICGGRIQVGEAWDADHPLARELGGADDWRELRPVHKKCHREKSKQDVALIAHSNRVRDKHFGFATTGGKLKGRGFEKRPPQRRASSPIRRKSEREATP